MDRAASERIVGYLETAGIVSGNLASRNIAFSMSAFGDDALDEIETVCL